MSCSDVCLSYGDADNDFYRESTPRARKPHTCCECGDTIQRGQRYERAGGRADGQFWEVTTCGLCREIRQAFVCGSWTFQMLWEMIREELFPIWETRGPIDCLAKVESLEARDKLRAEYRAWQERYA